MHIIHTKMYLIVAGPRQDSMTMHGRHAILSAWLMQPFCHHLIGHSYQGFCCFFGCWYALVKCTSYTTGGTLTLPIEVSVMDCMSLATTWSVLNVIIHIHAGISIILDLSSDSRQHTQK